MNDTQYEELTVATPEDAQDLAALVPQMTSRHIKALDTERLGQIILSGTLVLVARVDGRIKGVVALGVVHQLVGEKYWLEDLVVDSEHRGRRIAAELMRRAIARIPEDAYSVNLTSGPTRPEVRAWYERLGFEHKSNVYRLKH
jgi:ribosomal protein S18 acetylase RimI-like enzyme